MSTIENSHRTVLVTGSHGMIAGALIAKLTESGYVVRTLVRDRVQASKTPNQTPNQVSSVPTNFYWSPDKGEIDTNAVEGVFAVVHLGAVGIADKRWSDAHKARIVDSRLGPTSLLATTIAAAKNGPTVFLSGSACGFYGDRPGEQLPESSAIGTGFLADLVGKWEAATAPASSAGVRTATLRTSLVLSSKGGALQRQLLPFKLGLGGRIGDGKQFYSWITLADEVNAIMHLMRTPEISGPVNLATPNPVTNSEFTKALGKVLGRPTLVPTPTSAIGLLFGKEMVTEMLLPSQRLVPKVLTDSGFKFEHPEIGEALSWLIKNDH